MAKVEAFVINASAVALSMDQIGSLESYLNDCAKKVRSPCLTLIFSVDSFLVPHEGAIGFLQRCLRKTPGAIV